jgi:hypothetical protein
MEDTGMTGIHVLRRTLLAAALLIGLGTWAAADARITVMLRSGEKLSGRYDGFANGQFYLDTDTEDRKIPLGDIALIDLVGGASGLPDNELREAGGGSHVLLTKNGAMTKGHLVRFEGGARIDEGGDIAYVVFRTEGGEERRVPFRDVGRLYLGNFPGAPSTPSQSTSSTPSTPSGPAQAGELLFTLPANQQWLDTGVTVRQGQALTFRASGEITLSSDSNDKAIPQGSLTGRRAANAPARDILAGAVIGRIGNGQPFAIGAGPVTINAPGAGRLYVGINDDVVTDNTGQFEIRIQGAGGTNGPSSSYQQQDNNQRGQRGRRRP